LSILPSPIPELQHAPLPLQVLWARERLQVPTPSALPLTWTLKWVYKELGSASHNLNDSPSNDDVIEFQSMIPIFGNDVIELALMMPISIDDPFVSTKLKMLTPMHELNLQCINQVLRTHRNIVKILRSFGKFYQCKSDLCTLDCDTIDIYRTWTSCLQSLMGQ
jgi:hypothetical protein